LEWNYLEEIMTFRFVIVKGGAIHAYLGNNMVAFKKQIMGIASLVKEIRVWL
jgi:hypothetical protein